MDHAVQLMSALRSCHSVKLHLRDWRTDE